MAHFLRYLIWGAVITQWIHFAHTTESQAHHPHFYQFIFELRHVKKTKINKKRPGMAHLINYDIVVLSDLIILSINSRTQKQFLFTR